MLLTLYLAAIIHDYDHRGVNNQFLVRSVDPLALRYNDASPMENHHVSAAFTVMREMQYNFLGHASSQVRHGCLAPLSSHAAACAHACMSYFASHCTSRCKTWQCCAYKSWG